MRQQPDIKSDLVECEPLKVGDIVVQTGAPVELEMKKGKVLRLPIRIAGVCSQLFDSSISVLSIKNEIETGN